MLYYQPKNMLIIRHRVNSVRELKRVPHSEGIEVDIREWNGKLHLEHDPYKRGESLETYLKTYSHRLLILNVKGDGYEPALFQLMNRFKIRNYFLLDVQNPTLVKLTRNGMSNVGVRFSEYEPIESCLAFAGKAKWLWVDCFNTFPLDSKNYQKLKKYFKICLVSPELQKHSLSKTKKMIRSVSAFSVDAVCTDDPSLWQNI